MARGAGNLYISGDEGLVVYGTATGQYTDIFEPPEKFVPEGQDNVFVNAVLGSYDGEHVYMEAQLLTLPYTADGALLVYQTKTNQKIGSFSLLSTGGMVLTADGTKLYASSGIVDNATTIGLIDLVAKSEYSYPVAGYDNGFQVLQISPEGQTLYASSEDGYSLFVLDAPTGAVKYTEIVPLNWPVPMWR